MSLLALGLLAFAVADLLRWSPEAVTTARAVLALLGATSATVGVALLSGFATSAVVLIGAGTIAALAIWLWLDQSPRRERPSDSSPPERRPGLRLAWIAAVLLALFAASGSTGPIDGTFEDWYSNLAFPFTRSVSVDQFMLGICAALFLLSTSNRIVRLVLAAAGTPTTGENTLRGGRLLGPMERLIVGAMVISGDPAGAALVIAAKGLLRLPEIRSSADEAKGQGDQVTEYFLIGTFTSLLLAAGLALAVLGAS